MNEQEVLDGARGWYQSNWDADLTVGEWFRLMYDSGWGYPTWPVEHGGMGLPISLARIVRNERKAVGALGPPSGIGPSLLAPMLFKHGNPEQTDRLLRGMAYENVTACQMLSEPDAGSDLASSRAAAIRDGDEWRISGSKIWTSNVAIVTYGMLLARTDWDAPKHSGLSFFLCPAQQEGVEAHPVKQMNGRSDFNLVHFNDAIVQQRDMLGAEGEGWAVTRTFLTYEKNSFNPAAHEGGPFTGVDLTARAGDVADALASESQAPRSGNRGIGRLLTEMVKECGLNNDPHVRQELAHLYTLRAIMGYTNIRMRSGNSVPGLEGPMSKLTVSDITRRQRDLGLQVLGARGMLTGPDSGADRFVDFALSSPATSIAGGTDEIQKNHLAEKVLGLPREPGPDKNMPFSEYQHGSTKWS